MQKSPFPEIAESERIAVNRSGFAIWDRFPVSRGHFLVVPHRLVTSWWQVSAEERADLFALVDEVRILVEQDHNPDGYNIGINAGVAAGQTVMHLHVHLIPRYDGDTL